jgi:filamentous hemagglutinin family protein
MAQIVPDSTLGTEQSILNRNVTINNRTSDRLEGGARRGANLFHSFDQFNINDGQRLYFANPDGITNIVSRITGDNPSNILGTLGVQGAANLFLLNPNGIVFGKNATLDIRGSFIATTANSLRFADGREFNATGTTANPLLTISTPIGLQTGSNPGSIRVQGNGQGLRSGDSPEADTTEALRVPSNKTLALVGGSIVSTGGTLKTDGGRLELGSLSGSGFVTLTPSPKGFTLGYDSQTPFGDIQLLGATSVDASGRAGGDIQVRGKRITLQGGSTIEATTLRNAAGGSITLTVSELVELSGTTADNPGDFRQIVTSISVDNRDAGRIPGQLTINTAKLNIQNGARISAGNTRDGVGGNIDINATDSVELIGTGSSAGGQRSSGISVQTRGNSRAGDLSITTRHLVLRGGSEVSASTFAAGDGGSVSIQAIDQVDVIGASPDGALRSRMIAEVGNPGDVVRRRGDQTPTPAVFGRGGSIAINTNKLTVQDRAAISVSSRTGVAGNVNITARSVVLNQGRLTAETGAGTGAEITLEGLDSLVLRNNSLISAQAFSNATGGNVTIDAANGFLVAVPNQNSDIIAIASRGRGGTISITTQGIYGIEQRRAISQNQTNDIDASSEFNQPGTVTINQPDIDPTRGTVELPSEPRSPEPLASCQPGGGSGGRFVATGSGGLPTHPDEPLSSLESLDDLPLPARWNGSRRGDQNRAAAIPSKVSPSIAEAQGWTINPKGKVKLVANQVSTVSCSSTARSQN